MRPRRSPRGRAFLAFLAPLAPLAALAALLAWAAPAPAQDGPGWTVQVTPYLWGSGVAGEVTPFAGGPTLGFDSSLPEVLEDLDGAAFLSGSARRGRLVLLGDLSASSTSREGVVPPGLPAEGGVDQRSVTLAAGLRLPADPRVATDLLLGLRAWDVEARAAAPVLGLSATRSAGFTDPLVAVRTTWALGPRLSALLYLDVGGFGVGSEATSQAVAALGYAVTDRLVLSTGWRRLAVDYEGEGAGFEAVLEGPLAGLTWRF